MEKTIHYLNGDVVYTGQVVGDVWEGHGKLQEFENGKLKEEYEGDFKKDSRDGNGRFVEYNKTSVYTYVGQWVNDYKQGNGKETIEQDGVILFEYEGNFVKNKKHGYGISKEIFRDKSKTYKGNWKNDNKHGDGTQIYEGGFTYSGTWENNKLIDGALLYEDIEILFTFESDRYVIYDVHNPTFRTIDIQILLLDTILNFDKVRILTLDMYYLIGFLNSSVQINQFIEDINTRHCAVRLVALCHGSLLSGFPLSIPSLQRISNVPNGICNFDTLSNKINILNLHSIDDKDYIQQINTTFMTDLKQKCMMNPSRFKNGDIFLEMCRTIRTIPTNTFVYQQPILNKMFSSGESKVCLLLLYNDRGEYINLFSLQSTFTLQNVLKRIPNCSNCIFVDLSCSSKDIDINYKQLQYMGGKRKTKKNKKQ